MRSTAGDCYAAVDFEQVACEDTVAARLASRSVTDNAWDGAVVDFGPAAGAAVAYADAIQAVAGLGRVEAVAGHATVNAEAVAARQLNHAAAADHTCGARSAPSP